MITLLIIAAALSIPAAAATAALVSGTKMLDDELTWGAVGKVIAVFLAVVAIGTLAFAWALDVI